MMENHLNQNTHTQTQQFPSQNDLYNQQTRQHMILEGLHDDIREIKEVLVGSDRREGLVIDVDRLKRSRALFHGIMWVVFTAAIGTTATVVAAYVQP